MSIIETRTDQIHLHAGKTVALRGHVQALRDLGNLVFLVLRDAKGVVQIVAEESIPLQKAKGLLLETPVTITGTVVSHQEKGGKLEINLLDLSVLAAPAEAPPIEIGKQKKMDTLSLSTMLDYRPLTLRNEKVRAIFRIEAALCAAFRQFLNRERFVEIHTPKIVSTGTEGGAQLFTVDYFGKRAYLAQSPQFYKQIMVGVFERVFEIGPVYRAEEHDTSRHLNEYISMDLEIGFIRNEQDLIALQTSLLRFMFQHLQETCAYELEQYSARVPKFEQIPQLTLEEALSLLHSKLNWKAPPGSRPGQLQDLDAEAERLLCQHFHTTAGCDLLYITQYPHRVRPFYALPLLSDRAVEPLTASFDLLFRGLEVTTGGQRIHNYAQLSQSITSRGLDPANFSDYMQCFRYGMPPHGGFAMGLERLAKQLLGLPTVKLSALFPRDLNRISP